jgi:hypothetical protein
MTAWRVDVLPADMPTRRGKLERKAYRAGTSPDTGNPLPQERSTIYSF